MAKVNKEDEKNPLEAEILREVAAEIKEEQVKKMWKKISPIVTAVVLVVLVATGGFEYYKHRQQQQALVEAGQLQAALSLIQDGNSEEGGNMLKTLRDSSSLGYRYLAALHYVDFLMQEGRTAEAVEGLNFIANDKEAPSALRSLALLNKVSIAIDMENPDYDALNADLEQVMKQEDAWGADALELSALIALRQGDYEKAKSSFQQIVALPNVAEVKKMRATENLDLLNKKLEAEDIK